MIRRAACFLMVLGLLIPSGRAEGIGLDEQITRARARLDSGDAAGAIALLADASSPSAESLYVLGLAYQVRLDEVGLFSKRGVAIKLKNALHEALELDPGHLEARAELADFYHYAPRIVGGGESRAEQQIELLRLRSPAAAARLRGRHAYDAGEYREAERHLNVALELDPGNVNAWFLRGRARQQFLEKDEAALSDFKRALELGLEDDSVHYYVGRLCVRLEVEPDLAESSAHEFIRRSEPRSQALGFYLLASLRERQGRLEEARKEVDAALDLRSDFEAAVALRKRVARKIDER